MPDDAWGSKHVVFYKGILWRRVVFITKDSRVD
jgi:hypothetical protein